MNVTDQPTADTYLLLKRGLYYRPNGAGYTGIRDHAGRYTKAMAEDHADPICGVSMVPEVEAPEFAPNCPDDIARAHLAKKRDSLVLMLEEARAEIEGHREAFHGVVRAKLELEVKLKNAQENHDAVLRMWSDLKSKTDATRACRSATPGGEAMKGGV